MSFPGVSVVHGSPQSVWMPIVSSATIYVGGIVSLDNSAVTEGVLMLPDAGGTYNETNYDIPLGVCIGTNRKVPLYSSTYLTEYITDPGASDQFGGSSIEYTGVEGPWAKGDTIPMVKVALINATSVLRAPIRNAAIGTAPTLLTVSATGTASGLTAVTNAADFASVTTPLSTLYFRTGVNAGSYRLCDTASSTTHEFDTALRNEPAIGDTAVLAPLRTHGLSTVMFDATTAMFIDCADAPVANGADRWGINVLRLDLQDAGNEYAEFCFLANHFQMLPTFA